jgi:hypothetical protein
VKRIHAVSSVSVAIFFFLASTVPVQAQEFTIPPVEVGLRVPLAGFVAIGVLDDWVRVEAAAAIPGLSAPLVEFEGRAAVKFFPSGWEREVAGLPLRPFVGGGIVLLRSVEEWVPGWVLAAGAEAPAPRWPQALRLILHAEGSLTLLQGASAPTAVFQLSFGASFSLTNLFP